MCHGASALACRRSPGDPFGYLICARSSSIGSFGSPARQPPLIPSAASDRNLNPRLFSLTLSEGVPKLLRRYRVKDQKQDLAAKGQTV